MHNTSIYTRRAPECYIEPILLNARSGQFQTAKKQTVGNRDWVPTENVTNVMDCKDIKGNSDMRSRHNKITH